MVNKYPYGIIYLYDFHKIEITVVAIAHLHREPDYWVRRVVND
ncbi:MAG TPA: hypothetical protein VFX43_02260 [Chitinophagaceae bacterium]|nr:hypothetical protein [Chitinophagaceae bacterium]